MIVENFKNPSLCESKIEGYTVPDGCMLLEGVFGAVDIENRNNRIYTRQEYQRHVNEMMDRINSGKDILGEMEHPNSMNINLNNVSHKILEVRIDEDGMVRGKLLLFDTTAGRNAQAIIKSGSSLPVSSRAMGTIDESKRVHLSRIETFDLVGTGGFAEADVSMLESVKNADGELLMESYIFDVEKPNTITESKKEEPTNELIREMVNDEVENNLSAMLPSLMEKLQKDTAVSEDVVTVSDMRNIYVSSISECVEKYLKQEFLTESVRPFIDKMMSEKYMKVLGESVERYLRLDFMPLVLEKADKKTYDSMLKMFERNNEAVSLGVKKWASEQLTESIVNVAEEKVNESTEKLLSKYTLGISEGIEAWINGDVKGEITESLKESLKDLKPTNNMVIDESKKEEREQNQTALDAINEKMKRYTDIAKANREKAQKEKEIQENYNPMTFDNNPLAWLRDCPYDKRHIWESLSEKNKTVVIRQANKLNLNSRSAINEFWANLNVGRLIEHEKGRIKNTNESFNREEKKEFTPMQKRMLGIS